MKDFNSILLCSNTKFMELIKKIANSLFGSNCSEEIRDLVNCIICNILWSHEVERSVKPGTFFSETVNKLHQFGIITIEKRNPLVNKIQILSTDLFHKTFDKSLLLDFS